MSSRRSIQIAHLDEEGCLTYTEKLAAIDCELEALHRELESATDESKRKKVGLAIAVLQRSRRWYSTRHRSTEETHYDPTCHAPEV